MTSVSLFADDTEIGLCTYLGQVRDRYVVLDLRRSEVLSLIRVAGKVTDQTVESNWRWNTCSERRDLICAEVLSFSDYRRQTAG